MKLLFDENLSPKLCLLLADAYPTSESVLQIGLGGRPDEAVWSYAATNGFLIVSKDSDFFERAMLSGGLAKFVWLRLGNCTTHAAEQVLRAAQDAIAVFAISSDLVIELP